MNEQASAWLNCVEGLPAVHARLKMVVVLNEDALDVISKQDGEKTLFYLDPPYVPAARVSTGNYTFEMTDSDHRDLLATIKQCKGKVMLSGYPNDLYEAKIGDWTRHDFQIDNKVSGAKSKRTMTEFIWCNFCEIPHARPCRQHAGGNRNAAWDCARKLQSRTLKDT
jgi:DNA adenine methylase